MAIEQLVCPEENGVLTMPQRGEHSELLSVISEVKEEVRNTRDIVVDLGTKVAVIEKDVCSLNDAVKDVRASNKDIILNATKMALLEIQMKSLETSLTKIQRNEERVRQLTWKTWLAIAIALLSPFAHAIARKWLQ
jgi:hypothetical protein